ncbi:ARF1-directed GTPase-activating protein, putative [Babesia caballi]|uniref:ARF1-directed GTPase-activating protein, putative n=1 Tax=Babesia caballi TaxID=5871 RepID=A0AAV4LT25_BABCB|nr:ARF1-directed GTPase-activating protein, putative [Babesia caballi]
MDTWSARQLLYMKYGGNENLRTFFDGMKISDLPLSQRYKTEGAAYYRKRLRALVDGTPLPAPIEIDVACRVEEQNAGPFAAAGGSAGSAPGVGGSASGVQSAGAGETFTQVNIDSPDPVSERLNGGAGVPSRNLQQAHSMGERPEPQSASQPKLKHSASHGADGSSQRRPSDFLGSIGSVFGSIVDTAITTAESAVNDLKTRGVIDQAKGAFDASKSWLETQGKRIATTVQDPEWWENGQIKAKHEASKVAFHLSNAASTAQTWIQQKVAEIQGPAERAASYQEGGSQSSGYKPSASGSSGPIGVSGGANLWTEPKDPEADDVKPIIEQYQP